MADSVAEEYRSSLSELNFNSKPHINMLTMIAEENIKFAPAIIQTIVDHINTVTSDMMLPCLYLVDSIVKNIGKIYIQLFSKHLVALFTSVFKKVDENVRALLYKLRSTWTGIFPNNLLLRLDTSVARLDPAWPILAQSPLKNIHVNPKFLDKPAAQVPKKDEAVAPTPQKSGLLHEAVAPAPQKTGLLHEANVIKQKQLEVLKVLHLKKQQLLELKKKAATSTVVTEYLGSDVQKVLNARDPRLSKKASSCDATTLHSVVIIPKKGQTANKSDDVTQNSKEKHSTSHEAKKFKTDSSDSDSGSKKHLKNKLNNDKNAPKLIEQNQENKIVNINNHNKSRKRILSPNKTVMHSSKLINKGSTKESDINSINRNRVTTDILSESTKKEDTFDNFALNKEVLPDKRKKQYEQLNVRQKEPPFKNNRRLEPPPAPLFFGNEDKDYRTLIPQIPKSDERMVNEPPSAKCMPVPVVKSFKLDNKDRKVYFVNERSFVVMDDYVPRELTFEGPPKVIFVEGLLKPFELCFGGHEVKFEVDGKWNTIKFGTPAREVYINGYPYEATFGGTLLPVILEDGKVHRLHISGPPPQVILSQSAAYELYDKFCQSNQEFLSRYDNLHNVNPDVPAASRDVDMRVSNNKFSSTCFNFPVEKVNDVDWHRMPIGDSKQAIWNAPKNSFESFRDENSRFMPNRNYPDQPDWNRSMPDLIKPNLTIPPPLPSKQLLDRFPIIPPTTTFGKSYSDMNIPRQSFPTSECSSSVSTSNSMPFPHPNYNPSEFAPNSALNKVQFSNTPRLTPPPLPPFFVPIQSNTCMTAPFVNTVVTTPMPMTSLAATMQVTSLTAPISVSTLSNPLLATSLPNPIQMTTSLPNPQQVVCLSNSVQVPNPVPTTSSSGVPPVSTAAPVNMDTFFEQLVAAGIIGKKSGTSTPPPTTEPDKNVEDKKEEIMPEEPIPEIPFEPKSLKEYHLGVINLLHSGSQCATCGMRFKEIQSEQYSRHLDWHFRMNRREKDGAKKPFSRRLFYEIKDWIEFKEFEEVDERAPSYFELQASGEQTEENVPEIISSVPSTECESEICEVCSEQFQLFWVEEEEEWHLRNAVKHNGQVYHPACYEDFKKASEATSPDLEISVEESVKKTEEEEMDTEETKETIEVKQDEKSEPMEEEKKLESAETEIAVKVEPMEETKIIVKVQPMEETEIAMKVDPIEETEITMEVEPTEETPAEDEITSTTVDVKPDNESVEVEKSAAAVSVKSENSESKSSPNENVPAEIESIEELEFRPPTPDPKFQVLPPVVKGTELSALCTIM